MTHNELLSKLEKETKELEAFVSNANQEVVFRKGRIALLQELIAAEQPPEKPED